MSGKAYLEEIKINLKAGRNQHRMGQNLLGAFGYVRRRATAIAEINDTLEELGLTATPSITSGMPLKTPRIIFGLKKAITDTASTAQTSEETDATGTSAMLDAQAEDAEDDDINPPEPIFRVAELASATLAVECISPNASIKSAYTTMRLKKYSQLVVASGKQPSRSDIKGIISFQSIAKAMMNGEPNTVRDCIDDNVSYVELHDDLKNVVSQLESNEVVLVIGVNGRQRGRLQGIVTAWDLAEEFAKLADPFKRIEEIESRLRNLLETRIGKQKVVEFLGDQDTSGDNSISDLEELTIGALQRVLDYPEHWDKLNVAFDRKVFISALDEVRDYRNRLMHFRDPLSEDEMTLLTNFCDTVREIPL